jgi:hypothetical protein
VDERHRLDLRHPKMQREKDTSWHVVELSYRRGVETRVETTPHITTLSP